MATTAPSDLPDYRMYAEERRTYETLLMSIVTEFWLSTVNTFESLYEVVFQSVYSRTGTAKQCVAKFLESFPEIAPFTQLTLFDEGKIEFMTFAIRQQER